MAIDELQNFYKGVTVGGWGTGTGTFYVSVLPTPTEGYVVINPSNSGKREIIRYTSKGTDGTGNYLYVSARGVGGTSAVTHDANEPVRLNLVAEHISAIKEEIDELVLQNAPNASTSTKGISKLSVAPASATDPIAVGNNDPRILTEAEKNNIPSDDEKDALAGGGDFGTPGADNQFITEEFLLTKGSVRRVYNLADSPATWTKPTGLEFLKVEAWGAGGSGGSRSTTGAGTGGGGGAYQVRFFTASELGTTETVTVGAGGASVTGNKNGGAGGNTTFGSLLTALGGGGGGNGTGTINGGAAGNVGGFPMNGVAITGDTRASGIFAGYGGRIVSDAVKGAGSSYYGGAGGGAVTTIEGSPQPGGTSQYGGNGGAANSSAAATAGSVPAGGGGGCAHNHGSGAGGAGRCIVTEFY